MLGTAAPRPSAAPHFTTERRDDVRVIEFTGSLLTPYSGGVPQRIAQTTGIRGPARTWKASFQECSGPLHLPASRPQIPFSLDADYSSHAGGNYARGLG